MIAKLLFKSSGGGAETQLFDEEVVVEGVLYIVCRNEADPAGLPEREAVA